MNGLCFTYYCIKDTASERHFGSQFKQFVIK